MPVKAGEARGASAAKAEVRPVTPDCAMAGMSAATSARNVGAAAEPLPGPAKTMFAFWFANDTASVPLVVMGEPATDRKLGTLSATLVTEPLPPPAAAIAACTNAVVATLVELSLAGETVGAMGVPVNVGEASGALADKAV